MKSLSESLFDSDLVSKDIGFFDYYDWNYGEEVVVLPSGDEVPLRVALEYDFGFDQLFKRDKLNKLSHPRELINKSNDTYIFRNIYNTLSTSSIEEFGDKRKLCGIVSDAVQELLKVKIIGGGGTCKIYPSSRTYKTTLDDGIKSIMIINIFDFRIVQIGKNIDDTYQLKVAVSLKRKQ